MYINKEYKNLNHNTEIYLAYINIQDGANKNGPANNVPGLSVFFPLLYLSLTPSNPDIHPCTDHAYTDTAHTKICNSFDI